MNVRVTHNTPKNWGDILEKNWNLTLARGNMWGSYAIDCCYQVARLGEVMGGLALEGYNYFFFRFCYKLPLKVQYAPPNVQQRAIRD